MNAFTIVREQWAEELKQIQKSNAFRRFENGDLTIEHYKSFLKQTYFYVRENPQLQAYATAYFRGQQRSVIKRFYQHAISEIGHDEMALNDLKALGVDTSRIPEERPLPATVGLTSFAFYQIQFRNCLGYLGYLFHLEFMPTQTGAHYIKGLQAMGVPSNALTFLAEHAKVDVGHNKLMEGYLTELATTAEAVDEIAWSARTTCALYANMVEGALAAVK